MWKLNNNRLSFAEYTRLRNLGHNYTRIIQYARSKHKQCNSNLCTLYKRAKAKDGVVYFSGFSITPSNLFSTKINKAYIPYIAEHFGIRPKKHTVVSSDFEVSAIQKQVLMGSLLGDAHIPQNRGYRCNYVTMCHSSKQRAYLEWKFSLLGNLIHAPIRESEYTDKRSGQRGKNVYGNTIPHSFIRDMKHVFYPCQKEIPVSIISQLDALGLGVWYCDDGSIMRSKARLCTNCFSRKSLILIQPALRKRFGFQKLWVNADNILVFSTHDTKKLRNLISDTTPAMMSYKLAE